MMSGRRGAGVRSGTWSPGVAQRRMKTIFYYKEVSGRVIGNRDNHAPYTGDFLHEKSANVKSTARTQQVNDSP